MVRKYIIFIPYLFVFFATIQSLVYPDAILGGNPIFLFYPTAKIQQPATATAKRPIGVILPPGRLLAGGAFDDGAHRWLGV
jgi:hypothetical protein